MGKLKTLLTFSLLIGVSFAAAEINFRSDQPIDFYNNLNMKNHRIENLSAPVNANDAVRLQYLSGFVNRSGDTMNGTLNMNGYNISGIGDLKTKKSMRITGGPVGIGVNPSKKFEVGGDVKINGDLKLKGDINTSGSKTKIIGGASYTMIEGDLNQDGVITYQDSSILAREFTFGPNKCTGTFMKQVCDIDDDGNFGSGDPMFFLQSLAKPGDGALDKSSLPALNSPYGYSFVNGNVHIGKINGANLSLHGNLDMNGNTIGNLSAPVNANQPVRLQDLSGFVNRSGDTMAGNLYFDNYNITNPSQIKTGGNGGDTITIRDTNNSQDIARFNEGGNVEIPNGYLQFGSGNNEIQGIEVIRAGGSVASLHTGGSGSGMWRVYDTANSNNIAEFKEGGNVEIPNGDLKMAGNNVNLQGGSVTTDTGEVCIGDECS